jgi:hypothetical protein
VKTVVVFSARKDEFRFWANDAITKSKSYFVFDRSSGTLDLGEIRYQYVSRPDELLGMHVDSYQVWGRPPYNLGTLIKEARNRMRAN